MQPELSLCVRELLRYRLIPAGGVTIRIHDVVPDKPQPSPDNWNRPESSMSGNPTYQALVAIRDKFKFAKDSLAINSMNDIKSAYRAGRDAVSGASRRKQLMLLLLPGVGVLLVNFVLA